MLKIAVDFDGTIVEHAYPAIGKEKLFAFETLKGLQKEGYRIILWTFRKGEELNEAVEFCKKNGLEFYAVNKSYAEEVFDENLISRKIDADVFIDDKNFGGFPGWSVIWQVLKPETDGTQSEYAHFLERKKGLKKWFSFKKTRNQNF